MENTVFLAFVKKVSRQSNKKLFHFNCKGISNVAFSTLGYNKHKQLLSCTLKFDIEQQAKNIFGGEYFIVMTHNNEGKDDY